MATLFGGLHFRYMELFMVTCTRFLLHACAETLDTLRLYSTDPSCMLLLFSNDQETQDNFSQRTPELRVGILICRRTSLFGRWRRQLDP